MSTPTRADFTAALNATGLVTASDYEPEPAGEGNAWVQDGGWENDGSLPNGTFLANWLVFVIAPQDRQAASVWWDTHRPTLIGALLPLLYVTSAAPVVYETQAGDLFAYLITGRSE